MLIMFNLSDVQGINKNVTIIEPTMQSNEFTSISSNHIIIEKDKQIAYLESIETLSLAIGVGGIISGIVLSVFFEIKRGKNHRALTDLILNGNNRIVNAMSDKKDEKHASKVSGSMNLDFSDFLLNYIQRFFLKISDIVNLLISLIAIFIGMSALIISIQPVTLNGIVISSLLVALSGFGIFLIPYSIIKDKLKKNNEKIFKIEDAIIQNYDYMNGKSNEEKNCILEELRQVFTNKKDIDRLMKILSQSVKN